MSTATVRTPKPPSAHVDDRAAENIPLDMRLMPCWVAWRWEYRDGKWTKPPIDPLTGNSLDATGPDSWMTFDKARELARRHGDGIGLALGEKGSLSGFVPPDIDHCIDDQGNIDPRALELVKRFDSYAERTPSGRGLRIWIRAKKPGDRCKSPSHKDKFLATVELYEHSRYLTVTGRILEGVPSTIANRQTALDELYGAMFGTGGNHQANGQAHASNPVDVSDEALLAKARKSKHGDEFSALYDRGDTGSHGGDESSADLALLNRLAFWTGCDTGRMETLFSASALGQREKWKSRSDYRARSIDKAIRDCTATYEPRPKPGAKPSANGKCAQTGNNVVNAPGDNRPQILIVTQEKEVNDQAVAALANDPDLYRLGYLLATILHEGEAPRGVDYPDGPPPQIATIEPATLRERMAASARWFGLKRGSQTDWIPAHPPDWSVQAVHKRGVWRGVRPVVGIIEAPTMRRDGSILSTPGYDPATRLFYRPNTTFEPIPESPKQWDAKQAKDELLDLVSEFPFKDDDHKAVWLAALLTIIGRASFEGEIPLFAFDGNCPGTGKSKLADLISLIASGRRMPRMVWPGGIHADEEIRKRITSLALAGTRFTLLDNVDVPIGGAPLDAALTGDCWEDRLLCTNKSSGVLPLVMTWFATGNNIQYRGDFIRRVLPCRIESKDENPEERTGFKYPDLNGHVKNNRGRFVRDALVILRAFRLLRNPEILPALGSFEVWTHAVADPVMWITGNNPFHVRPSIKASDHNGQMRTAMVIGWAELPGADSGLTVATALAILNQRQSALLYDTLRSALLEMSDKSGQLPSAKSIGKHLQAMEGRNVGSLYIRSVPNRTGINAWKIERIS